MSEDLAAALKDGECLVDSKGHSTNQLKEILALRLTRYYERRGATVNLQEESLEQLEIRTAREALAVAADIQQILLNSPGSTEPLLGARDFSLVRTLISIVFKWGPGLLLVKTHLTLPENVPVQSTSKINEIEPETQAEDYRTLTNMLVDISTLVFNGTDFAETEITSTILQTHLEDLLLPSLTVGWLPKRWVSENLRPLDPIRPLILRLLNKLSPYRSMIALGALQRPSSLPHVRKLSSSFLTGQLLRPQGLKGLIGATFGEGEASPSEKMPEKLEQIVKILTKIPSNMEPKEYFNIMLPRIIDLLGSQESTTNKWVASWAISRILSGENFFQQRELVSHLLLSILHEPFVVASSQRDAGKLSSSMNLPKLITLVTNADPSPVFITSLLSPIIPALYSISYRADTGKVADPALKESIQGILLTWGRITGAGDATRILWSIFEDQDNAWELDLEGNVIRRDMSETQPSLTLADLASANDEETDFVSMLNLYPDPDHYTQTLQKLDRPDILSQLFIKLLDRYRNFKGREDGDDHLRSLHCLQIIMRIQTLSTEKSTSSSTFFKPTHVLSFIKSVLEPSGTNRAQNPLLDSHGTKHPALVVEPTPPAEENEGDSDDEDAEEENFRHEDELTETSLNLLLSVLEGNEDLSVRTDPVLNGIFALLDPLTMSESSEIARLAREAKVTITARSLSSSDKQPRATDDDDPRVIYQKALKLIQDPILPVRAHGLLLLRQLVGQKLWREDLKQESEESRAALSPAILSIFMQFIMDEDSYLYLNAVQGLVAMVDGFGKDMLRSLVRSYCGGLEDGLVVGNLTQKDVDLRVRVGEALGSVIRGYGAALPSYSDLLLPPLLGVLRSSHLPTAIRMSAISLLAECQTTSLLAILPYLETLTNAMIDLLQTTQQTMRKETQLPEANDIDTTPTSTSTSFSAFRRAAIHFVAVVVRETINQINDGSVNQIELFSSTMKRLQNVLSYLAVTDSNNVVRVMAREASSEIEELHMIVAREALGQFQM